MNQFKEFEWRHNIWEIHEFEVVRDNSRFGCG